MALSSASALIVTGNVSTVQVTGNGYIAQRQTNTGYLPYTAEAVGNYSTDTVTNVTTLWFNIFDGYHNLRNTTTITVNLTANQNTFPLIISSAQNAISQITWTQYYIDSGGGFNPFIYWYRELQYNAQVGVCWAR